MCIISYSTLNDKKSQPSGQKSQNKAGDYVADIMNPAYDSKGGDHKSSNHHPHSNPNKAGFPLRQKRDRQNRCRVNVAAGEGFSLRILWKDGRYAKDLIGAFSVDDNPQYGNAKKTT